MAASFLSSSSQRITATPLVTSPPYTVGVWARPAVTGAAGIIWSLSRNGVANNSVALLANSTNIYRLIAQGGGTETQINIGTVNTEWTFFVIRFISATNRRLSILASDGSIAHGQNTTSVTVPSLDIEACGCFFEASATFLFSGLIAELWKTNTDIQEGGGELQDAMVRQLAYGGPFSVPHVAKDIIDYHSFRAHPSSDGDLIDEVWSGSLGRQIWSNTNGVTTGPHCPLPYWRAAPTDYEQALIV